MLSQILYFYLKRCLLQQYNFHQFQHHEKLKQLEIQKALANLAKGDDPKAVIEKLANQLTNKIIHNPSLKIKEAGSLHGEDLLEVINSIFLLKDER